jgi:hypothetical protein
MRRSSRILVALSLVATLIAPTTILAGAPPPTKQISGIARSGVTLFMPDLVAPPPGGSGGGGPHGGGSIVPSSWNNVLASGGLSGATYNGLPVNEPFIAGSGTTLIAGANDYRAQNGQGQAAAYWSADAGISWGGSFLQKSTAWDDLSSHGSGDPWLAFGTGDRAYYSAIYFDFNTNCDGGVYLVPAASSSALAATAPVEITTNGTTEFEDKSAVAVLPGGGTGGQDRVAVSWTRFHENDCTDTVYQDSPILARLSETNGGGGSFGSEITIPAPTAFSQGSFPVFAAGGDLYVAFENWANATDVNGRIVVARVPASGEPSFEIVTPITDLPSPLPNTKFRTNSFPALAIVNGNLAVTWAEAVSGHTEIKLATKPMTSFGSGSWSIGRVDADVSGTALSVDASDRFFPAIASTGADTLGVTWLDRRDDGRNKQYRAWTASFSVDSSGAATGGTNQPVGTVLSDPSKDPFFRGAFIGDYIGAAYDGNGLFHPAWTDMRTKAPLPYHGQTQEIWTTKQP